VKKELMLAAHSPRVDTDSSADLGSSPIKVQQTEIKGDRDFRLVDSDLNEEGQEDDMLIDQGEMTLQQSPIRVQTTTKIKSVKQTQCSQTISAHESQLGRDTSVTEVSMNAIGLATFSLEEQKFPNPNAAKKAGQREGMQTKKLLLKPSQLPGVKMGKA